MSSTGLDTGRRVRGKEEDCGVPLVSLFPLKMLLNTCVVRVSSFSTLPSCGAPAAAFSPCMGFATWGAVASNAPKSRLKRCPSKLHLSMLVRPSTTAIPIPKPRPCSWPPSPRISTSKVKSWIATILPLIQTPFSPVIHKTSTHITQRREIMLGAEQTKIVDVDSPQIGGKQGRKVFGSRMGAHPVFLSTNPAPFRCTDRRANQP